MNYSINEIESVECIGEFENEYVYDIEMEDDTEHTFFANDILIHNSCYFTIQPVLDKLEKSFFNKEGKISKAVFEISEEIEETLNNAITLWAGKSLNSYDPRFVFKREAICDAGIFIQKKRYILHVLDDEGIEIDKYKYVGVEVASTATPKAVKPLIKRVVETMVKTKDYKETNKVYMAAFDEFKELPIEEIAFPRGVNNMEKYATMPDTLEVKSKTPIGVKAAMRYNYMLKRKGVEDKYEPIKSGIKIKFFYTKPNAFGIKVMGFLDKYPDEFNIEIDKEFMFKKTVYAAVERLYKVVNWRIQDPNAQTVHDLFELLA